MNIYPVIMAGGKGTRFWPLSRKDKPKQFLPIISDKTMLEETVNRLLPEIPFSQIYTVANSDQTRIIRDLLPGVPQENLLVEPQGKNTAPSLILATATVYLRNPQAVVAALPSDHLITAPGRFLAKLIAAGKAAAQEQQLITFGIPPAHPATGYGYIQIASENSVKISGENFLPVLAFKEKPDYQTARAFCEAGNFYWNSGMFIWQTSVFVEKLRDYAPDLYFYWEKMLEAVKKEDRARISSLFEEMPSTSIDCALMEKSKGILMARGDFGWSDVGSWSALSEIWPRDEAGNAGRGEIIALDSKGCLLYTPQKLTALIGVEDLIIVDTPEALLVCHKDLDQRVKDIVGKIKES